MKVLICFDGIRRALAELGDLEERACSTVLDRCQGKQGNQDDLKGTEHFILEGLLKGRGS